MHKISCSLEMRKALFPISLCGGAALYVAAAAKTIKPHSSAKTSNWKLAAKRETVFRRKEREKWVGVALHNFINRK
jgi:hypothetical protein